MYPLKFESLYYEKIWGSESWDVACHKNGMSILANGDFKGMRLDEFIERQGDKILGTKIKKIGFLFL